MHPVLRAALATVITGWLAVMAAACVHEQVRHPRESLPALMVARSDDRVLLQWASRKQELYSIMWADSDERTAPWRPLAGAVRLPGTGATLSVEDRVPPGIERHYRLSVETKAR